MRCQRNRDLTGRIEGIIEKRLFRKEMIFNQGGSRWREQMPQAVLDHRYARTDIVRKLGYPM